MPRVVITMPAYEAEGTLERTVAAIPHDVADELIVVDDASRDGTAALARQMGLRVHVHPENRGYGANQKSCYTLALASNADIVVLLHPDYQYEPKAVPLLIAPILAGDADMTFGSRFAGLGDPIGGGMPRFRYVGNRLTTITQNVFLGTRFTDMHSGMRAYTRRCLLSMPFLGYSEGFAFDAEFLVDAVTSGQRVVEVPIPTRYEKASSSISVSKSLAYVKAGTVFAARRGLTRGRRGNRYLPRWRQAEPKPLEGPTSKMKCVGCDAEQMVLRYPATAHDDVPIEEFRCTTSALSVHDDIFECPRCGLLSSRPSLAAEAIRQRYAEVVDDDYFVEEGARRELFSWVLDRVGSFSLDGRRLFEIGSNVGLFLKVASDGGWNASGIEPSVWAVQEGKTRFGVNLRVGTVEDMQEPPGSADAVVMLDVLEHLVDPRAALKRVRPLVAERGILALATVNVESIHARVRRGSWPWFIRSHLHYFRPATLCSMLNDAGFEVVEWSVVPRSFHLSYLLHRLAGEKANSFFVKKLTDLADPKVPVGWLGDVTLVLARPKQFTRARG